MKALQICLCLELSELGEKLATTMVSWKYIENTTVAFDSERETGIGLDFKAYFPFVLMQISTSQRAH